MLPRIGTARAAGRADESLGRSGIGWVNPQFGRGDDFARWGATSSDGKLKGNIGGVTLVTKPRPGLDSNFDNWCGAVNREYRVEVPFSSFREDDDKIDADAFVRWYNQREADRRAQASRDRCPLPTRAILPWAEERATVLMQLEGAEVGTGKTLRLMAKADLLDHLTKTGPLCGIEALLESLVFRIGSLEQTIRVLDCSGSQCLGLMEFVGCLELLGLDSQLLTSMDDDALFRGLDRDRDGIIQLSDISRLSEAVKPKSPKKKRSRGEPSEEPVLLDELRLRAPQAAPDVVKAMAKWAHVARWMSLASQRSLALRTERFLKGWYIKDKVADLMPMVEDNNSAGEDHNLVAAVCDRDGGSHADTEGAACSPIDDLEPLFHSAPERRRAATSTPRELTLESLSAMREQDSYLRSMFNTAASQKLPDGTPEMTRADLHSFFQDLELADCGRHKQVNGELLDKLYDEAIALQCNFTRIGNGLTFWSMKVVLNNIIGPLGLGWHRLIERAISPEALQEAARFAEAATTR
jgi:hypothetical protein